MSLLLLQSCGESKPVNTDISKVIAQVGDEKLTEDMLSKVYPTGVDLKSESIKNYVRIWTESEVVILSAKKNLSASEKDFSKKLKNYENSLLKYSYEQKLLDSALVSDVSEEALENYFEKNKKNFELKENIVRVRYVKVPKKHSKLNKIKYMLQYKDSVQKERFFKLIQKENIFCVADDSAWMKLEELKTLVPIKLYNDEHFLRHYKYTEAPEGDDTWIVYFSENRLKEGVAPLEMVQDKIKAIIVNQRILDLIQTREKQLYEAAKLSGVLKINLD
jgi:hypothetical protein